MFEYNEQAFKFRWKTLYINWNLGITDRLQKELNMSFWDFYKKAVTLKMEDIIFFTKNGLYYILNDAIDDYNDGRKENRMRHISMLKVSRMLNEKNIHDYYSLVLDCINKSLPDVSSDEDNEDNENNEDSDLPR